MSAITNPIPYFTDLDGDPLDEGYIYVGVAAMDARTNPIPVFWDNALTIPAPQPIRTVNGYPLYQGRPAPFFISAGDASITVLQSNGVAVVTNASFIDAIASFISLLAGPTGADQIGMTSGGTVQDYIDDPGTAGPIDANFSGIPFTNAAHWASALFESNGATNGAWYSALQAGNNVTEAFSTGILVPSTATNHQTNGIGAYVRSERSQVGNGGDVAAYFQVVSAEDDCAAFALNTVATDTAGKTGQIIGIELDYNVNAADTEVNGINLVIVGNTPLTGNRNAVAVRGVFSANSKWSNAFVVDDGAVDSYALLIGCTGTGNNVPSQSIGIRSRSAGGTLQTSTILHDASGNLLVRPGAASGSVIIQAFDGSANYVTMNANGITTPVLFLGLLTFAQLPAAASSAGARATISNSTTNTFNAVAAGGGANIVPVFSDGTNWRVG